MRPTAEDGYQRVNRWLLSKRAKEPMIIAEWTSSTALPLAS
ncbi:MAG TPA: hypothetical protein VH063_00765 [Gaiellaceae bacterium]|jgi:hypothetical protein|nr:hypothetical protein [Gaiellaceae bacterium]